MPNEADTTDTVIHRNAITRSGNAATGLDSTPTGHVIIAIPGIRFLAAITTNTFNGRDVQLFVEGIISGKPYVTTRMRFRLKHIANVPRMRPKSVKNMCNMKYMCRFAET